MVLKLYTFENHINGYDGLFSIVEETREEAVKKVEVALNKFFIDVGIKVFNFKEYIHSLVSNIEEGNETFVKIMYDKGIEYLEPKLSDLKKFTDLKDLINMDLKEVEIGKVIFYQEEYED